MIKNILFILTMIFSTLPINMSNDITEVSTVNQEMLDFHGLYDDDILEKYNNITNNTDYYLEDNYSTYYFSNLKTNYGNNAIGSCGYVATGMLLSYWDTYWDDNVIPENYEMITLFDTNQFELESESPGIYFEPNSLVGGVDVYDYYQIVEQYSNFYFHLKLIQIAKEIFGEYRFDDPDGQPLGMAYSEYKEFFEYYIYDYRGFSRDDVEVIIYQGNSDSVKEKAIELIKQGIPVKLSIGGHAVVGYDYDEENDDIYCHFGWGSNATHVTINQMGYNNYYHLAAFKFNNQHSHSNNYKFYNEEESHTFCSCSSVLPSNIEIVNEYALDVLPTFKWNSLINEKWFTSSGLYHRFDILNSSNYSMYTTTCDSNTLTLNVTAWDAALNATGNVYKIYIGIESIDNTYWDDYYYSQTFSEPTEFINKIQIKPNEWGFEGRYYFESEGIKTSTLTKGDLTITTRRLRCGYIEDSYINLSPRREGAGEAYFEMVFDKPVYSFMYSICLWSGSEYLDGSASISVLTSEGEWIPYVNLLDDIELTIRTIGLERYCHYISSGIYGIKFEATSTATGDRNKGRLCIDDLVLSVNPGLINNYYLSTNYAKTNS